MSLARRSSPRTLLVGLGAALVMLGLWLVLRRPASPPRQTAGAPGLVGLPAPRAASATSVEEALRARRSVRDYAQRPLTLAQVGQLLWAAQGQTDSRGLRTAPSAGALYPLEIYLVAGEVEGLPSGVYRYRPQEHALEPISAGDQRKPLADASLGQTWVRDAPVSIVFAAVYARTARRYGERAERYVHMEAGHASQNVYLQAEALGLGTVAVGAFSDDDVKRLVGLLPDEQPLYIMPVGVK